MLKFFASCFDAICCIGAILNLLIFGGIGAFGGYTLAEDVIYANNDIIWIFLLAIAGIAIGFFVDIFVFGFLAQITEIRKNVEKLTNKE